MDELVGRQNNTYSSGSHRPASTDDDPYSQFKERGPGVMDWIERLFDFASFCLVKLVTPWTWIRRTHASDSDVPTSKPVLGWALAVFGYVSFWLGNLAGAVLDSIELFAINITTWIGGRSSRRKRIRRFADNVLSVQQPPQAAETAQRERDAVR